MATITTINASDLITNSRADINTNFANLNSDKIETSVLDTDTALTANSDAKIPSQKAVKTYIDTSGGANASTTARGIVEEATAAEVLAGSATGGTGARLFVNPSSVSFAKPTVRVYTASDTWSKPANLRYVEVEVVGGGGGGGGATNNYAGSGGGGGGGYSKKTIAVASLGTTETVTVGAAGAAGAATGGDGGAGGNSIFGAHATANGGSGGTAGSTGKRVGGAGGTATSGDINIPGGAGGAGGGASTGTTASVTIGGHGGSSILGNGAGENISSGTEENVGTAGGLYGGGGSGSAQTGDADDTAGGAGAAGIVIVTEYV